MPSRAARAPRQPKYLSPNISDRFTTFGPGKTWPIDSSSLNSAMLSQRWRSTSSRWATGSTPPKPISDRREKTQTISPSERGPGDGCPGVGEAGTGGVMAVVLRRQGAMRLSAGPSAPRG
jgi:hypothetical protein